MPSLTATYANNSWEQDAYSEPAEGPTLSRVAVKRAFHGDIEGTGEAILLMCQSKNGDAGYIASEAVVCTLAGKKGGFVLQHGATMGAGAQAPFGYIVPGSGTGDLAGISGTCVWRHDEHESSFELTYELADAN